MHLPPAPSSTDRLQGVSVLIVEDDGSSARLASAIVAQAGCDVRVVATAEEALALLAVFSADVVVTDVMLAQMNGFELARRIKADTRTREAIVIAVTASLEPSFESLAVESGCAVLLQKPLQAATVTGTLADLLEQRGVVANGGCAEAFRQLNGGEFR